MKALKILKHYIHSIVPIEYSPTFVSEAIKELEELKLKFDILTVDYKCLKKQKIDECDLIKTNKEHFYFLKQNERDFIAERFKSRFQLK